VFLDGIRDGKPVKGWFRNLRVWERSIPTKSSATGNMLACVFWFNKPLTS
jgi:hypothetical protein